VKALVYVNAYIPQDGDTMMKLTAAQPGSALDPQESINAVPIRDASGDVVDVDVYLKPGLFGRLLAGDVQNSVVATLAANQRPLTLSSFSEAFTGTPAWQTIPSWAVVGTEDQVIPSAAQELMANQAGARVVKAAASHLSMISHPEVVTALIVEATN
jgi:pimeloyl-ACP methyl ester carboxylesterase